jgi:hypothetical protein
VDSVKARGKKAQRDIADSLAAAAPRSILAAPDAKMTGVPVAFLGPCIFAGARYGEAFHHF